MKIFILEDEVYSGGYEKRDRLLPVLAGHDLTVALNCEEGKRLFNPPYDLMLLDHDMEGVYENRDTHPNTGFQFVKWMLDQKVRKPYPQVILHSVNTRNRKRMKDLLEDANWHVVEMPFNDKYIQFLKETF